jgi:hypothetical protein
MKTNKSKIQPPIDFLTDPRLVKYFGGSFEIKADVLAAMLAGKKLSPVAARHGVSMESVWKPARTLRRLFPNLNFKLTTEQ